MPTRTATSSTLQSGSPVVRRAATMADVALAAGVTKMAVSYAFSGKGSISEGTRQLILQAAQELNFAPNSHAQKLAAGGKSRDICLYSPNLSVGVDLLKVNRLRQRLQECGYSVSVHSDNTRQGQQATLAALRSQRPAALLCDATDLLPQAVAELGKYQEDGGLLVCYDHELPLPCDSVTYAHEFATLVATRHLLELGHRDLGLHILGPARGTEPQFVTDSIRGFENAALPAGANAPDRWRYRGLSYENHEEGGAETALRWLESPRSDRPTAMCMVNDTAAAAFIATLLRAGIDVPGQVSVVSTDNLPISMYSAVPLSTVSQPVDQMVSHLVQILLARLDGHNGPPQNITVHGELIVRESTSVPRPSPAEF